MCLVRLSCFDMEPRQWKAKNKNELAIEVWEALDCESVGRAELEAIAIVVRDVFGAGAVESPMRLARLLADEGAELRHFEVLELDVERRTDDPYQAVFRNLIKLGTFNEAAGTLRNLENLRRKFATEKDREGTRRLLDLARRAKQRAQNSARNPRTGAVRRQELLEIAEWLTVWLNQPVSFDVWLELRRDSADFQAKFAPVDGA
jgi:hypothetical protein